MSGATTVSGPVSRYRRKTVDLGADEFDDLGIAETGSSTYSRREGSSAEPATQVIDKIINSLSIDRFEG